MVPSEGATPSREAPPRALLLSGPPASLLTDGLFRSGASPSRTTRASPGSRILRPSRSALRYPSGRLHPGPRFAARLGPLGQPRERSPGTLLAGLPVPRRSGPTAFQGKGSSPATGHLYSRSFLSYHFTGKKILLSLNLDACGNIRSAAVLSLHSFSRTTVSRDLCARLCVTRGRRMLLR